MQILRNFILLILLAWANFAHSQWINEIHYDNSGTDVNECVEVVAAAGTNMACIQIILYNGSGGASYYTGTFSGTMGDEGCGFGAMSDCSMSSIQNGNPDGIALYNSCTSTVIQFLSYGGSFTASNGPASGMTSTNIGVTETGTTLSTESLQLTGSGSSYGDYTWQTPATSSMGSLNSGQSISPCTAPPTITTGAITGAPFTVDCSVPTTDNGSLAFTTVGTFNVGNTFTIEMSNASGSFASPTTVGTLTGASAEGVDPSGSINFTIPSAALSGTGYLFRIVSDNPIATGSNSASFTITQNSGCTGPWMTSVLINSCNGMCSEGYNEIVFGSSGDYAFDVNTTDFNFTYGSNAPPTANTEYTDVLVNNATTIADLNTAAGCPGLFIDAASTTIPADASWMLAYTDICDEALTWSGLCGSGPIYVILQDDPNWNIVGGNYANNPGGIRYFQTSITTTTGETFTIDYSIDGAQYANSDGAYATFGTSGGAAITYGDDNCTLNPVVLPVELTKFTGENQASENLLYWQTISEYNSNSFTIERSIDAENWSYVGSELAAQNSQQVLNYQLMDDRFDNEINYYRLIQYDMDGWMNIHPHYVVIDNRRGNNGLIGIFNLLGQEVDENYSGIQIHLFENGTTTKIYK